MQGATSDPVKLISFGILGGALGSFVYNRYLSRLAEESRNSNITSNSSRSNPASGASSQERTFFYTEPAAQQYSQQQRSGGDDYDEIGMFSNQEVRVEVLNHLTRVYATVAATCLAGAVGTAVQMKTNASSGVSGLVGLGFALAVIAKPKLWKLLGFGFFEGMSLGSLVKIALAMNPTIVPMALGGTTGIMASLTAASLLTRRRSMLFLYGALGSILSGMAWASLFNLYFKSRAVFNAQLYGGLALFFGYVMADTQYIVEKADMGDRDYVTHAWMLFTDAAAIFTRLVIIMLKNQNANKSRRSDSDDDENEDDHRRSRQRYNNNTRRV